MGKWIRRLIVMALALALVAAVVLFPVYRLSQWEPAFYDQAVRIDTAEAARAGDELERNVLAAHNEVVDDQSWQIIISDDQVNGWLTAVLPEKFPQWLPHYLQDPRVEFRAGRAEVACRYLRPGLSVVVSVAVEASLTDEPNTIAVRIRQARFGALPGLKKKLVQRISHEARRVGIPLKWTQVNSDPVALVTLEAPEDREGESFRLEVVEVREDQLVIAGRGPNPNEAVGRQGK